jgi:hypothetical protein
VVKIEGDKTADLHQVSVCKEATQKYERVLTSLPKSSVTHELFPDNVAPEPLPSMIRLSAFVTFPTVEWIDAGTTVFDEGA